MGISELIENRIIELAKKYQEDRSNTIHVTDLTTCIRKSYYIKKYGFPMDKKMAFWMLFGALVHEIVNPTIAEAFNGQTEVRKTYKFGDIEIEATPDILTDNMVIEVKTCARVPERPYSSHQEQINAYLHIFDRPKGLIVYISRTELDIRTFEYYGDAQLFNYTLDKALALYKALESNTPPDCNIPLSERKFYCRNCQFRHLCELDSYLQY